jgi:hypothetical protein
VIARAHILGGNEGEEMLKTVAAIIGAVLLLAGIGAVIVHYTVEGGSVNSYLTLAIAAVLLVAGWALFDWGLGLSRRWRSDDDKRHGRGSR